MPKVSGALKRLIKRYENGSIITKGSNPLNYQKVLDKIKQRENTQLSESTLNKLKEDIKKI